jgi:hypothetical protein
MSWSSEKFFACTKTEKISSVGDPDPSSSKGFGRVERGLISGRLPIEETMRRRALPFFLNDFR